MTNTKLYDVKSLAMAVNAPIPTIANWADIGLLVNCPGSPPNWRIFDESEKLRLEDARRLAGSHPRKVGLELAKTLHSASPSRVITAQELAGATGRCTDSAMRVTRKLGGLIKKSCGAVIPEELRAEAVSLLESIHERETRKAPAAKPVADTKTVSVNIKGIKIELSRDDAEKLAGEIIDQL